MHLTPMPPQASWHHRGVREGFEVVWPTTVGDLHRLRGATTGVEEGAGWSVSYDIELDRDWRTRTAVVRATGRDGAGEVLLERDDDDRWSVDGLHWPSLDGVADIDLESSAVTNALPLRRLDLRTGTPMLAQATFVGLDLRVVRLDQTYELVEQDASGVRVSYTAPTFEVSCLITYDGAGLVTDYPGIAVRQA